MSYESLLQEPKSDYEDQFAKYNEFKQGLLKAAQDLVGFCGEMNPQMEMVDSVTKMLTTDINSAAEGKWRKKTGVTRVRSGMSSPYSRPSSSNSTVSMSSGQRQQIVNQLGSYVPTRSATPLVVDPSYSMHYFPQPQQYGPPLWTATPMPPATPMPSPMAPPQSDDSNIARMLGNLMEKVGDIADSLADVKSRVSDFDGK